MSEQKQDEHALVRMLDGYLVQIRTPIQARIVQHAFPDTLLLDANEQIIAAESYLEPKGHYHLRVNPNVMQQVPNAPKSPTCSDICMATTFNYKAPKRACHVDPSRAT